MPKEKIIRIIDKISIYLLAFLAFTVPLFFLPLTPDFYNWNKQVLILTGGIVLFLLWGLKSMLKGEVKIIKRIGTFWKIEIALLTLPLLHLISTFFNPGVTQGLMGRTMLFVGLLLIYFSARQLTFNQEKSLINYLIYPLLASAVFLSLINGLGFLDIPEKVTALPGIETACWTPAGGQFALITLTLAALPAVISTIFREFKKEEEELQTGAFIFSFLSIPLIIASLAIFTINSFETHNALKEKSTDIENIAKYSNYIQLPISAGWKVSARILGNTPKTAFFGVGPQNFENAFRTHKPVSLTQTPFWNVVFGRATNEPLHLIITTGLLGFLAWVFFCAHYGNYLYNQYKTKKSRITPLEIALAVIIIAQGVFPPTLISWFLIYLLFSLVTFAGERDEQYELKIQPNLFFAAAIAFSALISFLTFRAYAAETKAYKATQELQKSNTDRALNLQKEAITLSPGNARYHYAYSRTLLALAQSIAQSEENRETIKKILQASIPAAERAVNINSTNADYWKIRGDAFWNLIGIQEGAAQRALDSYDQAVARDPLNPVFRVLRGKILAATGNWSQALDDLVIALQINPELPSAWYNLAIVLEGQEDYENAAGALSKTLKLLPEGSQSYNTVQARIEKLEKKASAEDAASASEEKLKDGNLEEILEQDIEKEASPSATPVTTPQEKEATTSAEQGNVEGKKTGSPFGSLAE